MGNDYAQRISL